MNTTPSSAAARPHMVMLVGNHVVGDSRVEKSAVSAQRAGYRVTVVGTQHRSTFPIGQYQGVPIYRAPTSFPRQRAWNQARELRPFTAPDWSHLLGPDGEPRLAPGESMQLTPETGGAASRRRRRDGVVERIELTRDRLVARTPGGWRPVWPHIADYEESFLPALMQLEPDLIHVHDKHPLAAAATYADLMRRRGRTIPWIYDAHEWVPGQAIPGAPQARIGWIAAEAELIRQADGVISVTADLADRMRRRHRLRTRPSVVINAPLAARTALAPDQRLPLRQECGLDAGTPLLVYIGRLAEVRGIFTMIEALPLMPDVHVAFVGNQDDALRQRMRDRAAELGAADRIHITDYVPSNAVTWYIAEATAGVSPLLPTPAHELAVPTKLREYVQAKIPMIVSDLTEQASFVRDQGVGTVFAPGDPASLAQSVETLLSGLPQFRTAVAEPAVQEKHTWEGAEKNLVALWHRLCPVPVPGDAHDELVVRSMPAGSTGTVSEHGTEANQARLSIVGGESTQGLARAWERSAGPSWTLPGREPESTVTVRLTEVLDDWLRVDQQSDAVIYSGRVSAFGRAEGGMVTELRSLQHRGRAVAVWSGHTVLADPELVSRSVPGHPMAGWTADDASRYRRQVRRAAQPILDALAAGVPAVTTRLQEARFTDAHWCPTPVPVVPSTPQQRTHGPAIILVVPTLRTPDEQAAIERMCARAADVGHQVLRPSSRRFAPSLAAQADIVVDALHAGEQSEAAAWAWRCGGIVLGQRLHRPTEAEDLPLPPIIEVEDESLEVQAVEWADRAASGEASAQRQAGREYGAAVHDGRLTVERLRALLGV